MGMNWLRATGEFCSCIAFAGLLWGQSPSGPSFDAKPIEIPHVQKMTPRAITSMDLLTLRDFHGSQISPDGKWLAFVWAKQCTKAIVIEVGCSW
jgi:hypothetical protein